MVSGEGGRRVIRLLALGVWRCGAVGFAFAGAEPISPLSRLRGRSVLVLTKEQLSAALALVELDGVARRLVLCPPGLSAKYIPLIVSAANIDVIVCDPAAANIGDTAIERITVCSDQIAPVEVQPDGNVQTEWVLLTSGTMGPPKMVVHTLATLTSAIKVDASEGSKVVWSTFYDIRRYGGLQIFLRAMIGGTSMVLSADQEFDRRVSCPRRIAWGDAYFRDALALAPRVNVSRKSTSLSRAMSVSPARSRIKQHLIICASAFREADISHAFASTEAGVAFDVVDSHSGFPASMLEHCGNDAEMKVQDGSLRIKSQRTALRYLGDARRAVHDPDGFVDTGDMVELRGGRYYFVGRRDGVINVGGL